jgi:hypothetical protein
MMAGRGYGAEHTGGAAVHGGAAMCNSSLHRAVLSRCAWGCGEQWQGWRGSNMKDWRGIAPTRTGASRKGDAPARYCG